MVVLLSHLVSTELCNWTGGANWKRFTKLGDKMPRLGLNTEWPDLCTYKGKLDNIQYNLCIYCIQFPLNVSQENVFGFKRFFCLIQKLNDHIVEYSFLNDLSRQFLLFLLC